jgi:hypothetical protein
MMFPLTHVQETEEDRPPAAGFCTGKELDPDFVDFNSVNRRYHFPARGYHPNRASFLRIDPLYFALRTMFSHRHTRMWVSRTPQARLGKIVLQAYGYVKYRPTLRTDATGLQEDQHPRPNADYIGRGHVASLETCCHCFVVAHEERGWSSYMGQAYLSALEQMEPDSSFIDANIAKNAFLERDGVATATAATTDADGTVTALVEFKGPCKDLLWDGTLTVHEGTHTAQLFDLETLDGFDFIFATQEGARRADNEYEAYMNEVRYYSAFIDECKSRFGVIDPGEPPCRCIR